MAKLKNTLFHPAVFIPILLVCFITSVALAKMLIWPSIKKFQAREYKENATQFLENENYRNAFIEIRKAILKDPLDQESYQIALKAAEKSADHFQYVPGFLAKLMEIDTEYPEHFIKFILITLQLGELKEAQNAYDKFPNDFKDTEEYHQLGYSIALENKDDAKADIHLSELIRLRPDDLKLQFTLSTLRLRSSDENTMEEAKKALNELATYETARTPALRVLLTHSLLGSEKEKTAQYMKELEAIDKLRIRDQLLILQCKKFVDEANFESHVTGFLALENTDPEDISMTLDFLLKNNMPEKASSWLDILPIELISNPIVVKKASQIYFITKDYEKLRKALLDEDWANQDYGRFLLLALTSKVEADPIAFRKYWQQCLINVGSNRDELALLFNTVSNWGWADEAIEVLEKSYHETPGDEEAFKKLITHFTNTGDTSRTLEVLARRIEFFPNDSSSKNNYALLSMLTGVNQNRAFSYAKENFNSDNSNPYFTTTWAFALMYQGRNQEALNLIEFLQEKERNDPQRSLYIAKIFLEAGKASLAKKALDNADKELLLGEEKLLLSSLERSIQDSRE